MPYKDPIKKAEYRKKWYLDHPGYGRNDLKRKASRRKWRLEHPTQESEYVNARNKRLRAVVVDLLGGKCSECPFTDPRALQIDHINGGGNKEIKETRQSRGAASYYKLVIASILNKEGKYQLLCANHNWIKRAENDEVYRKYPKPKK